MKNANSIFKNFLNFNISHSLLDTIQSRIQQDIYNDFENFIKSTNVYKNWYRTIQPKTFLWHLKLKIPRTRWSKSEWTTYIPNLWTFPSFSSLLNYTFKFILSLFASWNTFNDIRSIFHNIFWYWISNDLLSNIFNSVYDSFLQRKSQPLHSFYIAIFLDAIFINLLVNLNGSSSIKKIPVYFIIWLLPDWSKQVLDFFIFDNPSESSSNRRKVLLSLKNRWVHDIWFAIFDWLPWLHNAILSVFPNAILQKCIVHKLRNIIWLLKFNDQKDFIKDIKKVYNAPSLDLALKHLDIMKSKRKQYNHLLDSWLYDIDLWSSYFNFSWPIRKLVYTTNVIENFNWLIRQHLSKRKVFFTKKSAEIAIFLAVSSKEPSMKKFKYIKQLITELLSLYPHFEKYLTFY